MKVLIVSPNFCPLNTPDMQRARMVLPHLREQGWEPTVLAVDPTYAGTGVLDPLLEQTYPSDIRVVRVRGIPPRATAWLRFGTLWLRCGPALRAAGDALLREQRFDVVFFTTTIFDTFTFGPRWRRKFGVPYVLDYQDPWVNRYYERTGAPPPGGRLKYAITQWSARRREPRVVRKAAAIVTVSEAYASNLVADYKLDPAHVSLLPFGAEPRDFTIANANPPSSPLIDFEDGLHHHVYIGRCGDDMKPALVALFRAFRQFLATYPPQAERIRFHFIGTDYAPPPHGKDRVLPIAEEEMVGAHVHEHRLRVPYFEALYYLRRAAAIVAVGSDDPSYSASKVFPCILARRPLLFLFHEKSLVLKVAAQLDAGVRIAFHENSDPDAVASALHEQWFASGEFRVFRPYRTVVFESSFTAEALTGQLAKVFEQAAQHPTRTAQAKPEASPHIKN